jgi:hypothetical protein
MQLTQQIMELGVSVVSQVSKFSGRVTAGHSKSTLQRVLSTFQLWTKNIRLLGMDK